MKENLGDKPNRINFHALLNPAFIKSFSAQNIISSFKKSEIYPLNYDAAKPEALAPSQLTNKETHISKSKNNGVKLSLIKF